MKQKIQTVADSKLKKLLENLDLIEELQSGSILCRMCGKVLSLENIGCIYPFENQIGLCCDRLECLQKAIDLVSPMRRMEVKGGDQSES